jgi:hypothetical protein
VRRNEQRRSEAEGSLTLQSKKRPHFAAIYPGKQTRRSSGVLAPLIRIQIDHIEDDAPEIKPMLSKEIWRHRSAKYDGAFDVPGPQYVVSPLRERAALEIGSGEWRATHESSRHIQTCSRTERHKMTLTSYHLAQSGRVAHLGRVFDKRAEMYRVLLRQMRKHVVGADLLPLIGRERDAMAEK